jgi:hypothetical protein
MGEAFNPGFARYSRQSGCSFDVNGAKRRGNQSRRTLQSVAEKQLIESQDLPLQPWLFLAGRFSAPAERGSTRDRIVY